MKKRVIMSVDPSFKDLVKLEAKTKGMSIINYTKELTSKDLELDKIAEEWKGKYRTTIKHKHRGFDFL